MIVVFVVVLLVLALIGYFIDSNRVEKIKEELSNSFDTSTNDIPEFTMDSNVKLGETLNNINNVNSPVDQSPQPNTISPDNASQINNQN